MAKRSSSWGPVQEAYVNSPLAQERSRNAGLTGTLHRVCGLLALEPCQDALDAWCQAEERRRREENERKLAASGGKSG